MNPKTNEKTDAMVLEAPSPLTPLTEFVSHPTVSRNGKNGKNDPKKAYLIDMDGVLVHGQEVIPGAAEFIYRLNRDWVQYLVLTNNARYTRTDLQYRLQCMGLDVAAENIYTSAVATAAFVHTHHPHGSAYVVGDMGLYQALADVGYRLANYQPDYVILGETDDYPYDKIVRAIEHISAGVPFIATNPDGGTPVENGKKVPACGAAAALIEQVTGIKPYFIGKPNPWMLHSALHQLGEPPTNTIMVGDRMDIDIRMGLEGGMETVLVLTGVTKLDMLNQFSYRPSRVVQSVAELNL